MGLFKIINTLPESFSKTQVTDNLETIHQDLRDNALPMYESLKDIFGGKAFTSKWAENFFKHLKNRVGRVTAKSFIEPTLKGLNVVDERLGELEKLTEDQFVDDISIHALNVKRVNILTYIDAISFFVIYARRLAVVTTKIEINALSEDVTSEMQDILPYNIEWLNSRRDSWLAILDILISGKGDLTKVVDGLPDLAINPTNAKALEAVHRNLDPLGFGFIPVVFNPAYHIGHWLAEWQVNRLNTAVAEKEILEVQVMNLKLLKEGRNDARLQKSIEYIEDKRLKPLYQKIEKMEKKYGA